MCWAYLTSLLFSCNESGNNYMDLWIAHGRMSYVANVEQFYLVNAYEETR